MTLQQAIDFIKALPGNRSLQYVIDDPNSAGEHLDAAVRYMLKQQTAGQFDSLGLPGTYEQERDELLNDFDRWIRGEITVVL